MSPQLPPLEESRAFSLLRKPHFPCTYKTSPATPSGTDPNASPTVGSPSSTRDAKAGPTFDDPSTAHASGGGDRTVTDAQATDALAAEALDATDGVFTAVAGAIEAEPPDGVFHLRRDGHRLAPRESVVGAFRDDKLPGCDGRQLLGN